MSKSPESEHPIKAYGYAARDTSGLLSPLIFSRRATGDKDVRFKVLYCGICHSDLHFIKNEWGFTTYPVIPGPLRHFGLDKPGMKVGVVGLGGLGHVAVKFAKAFGAEVTVFSTTPAKKQEALEGLKADHFIVSKDPEQMQAAASSLDGIIDTVSATHPIAPLLNYVNTAMERLLKSDIRYRFVIDVAKSLKAP
ncbi:hypothetical protein M8C21_002209 [Ambrosia artemisiifolia]|uniref:Alcohol dehydrogenase-like C-terminal domain-containing protein n=1 Tax=Ambrosia artemisiifolia TaxID=4212 RepID=A0AAD5D564_AMBAR|nr:hypothetical protein M8C21_002209 [Ambrosia artemisiifolia]